MPETKFTHVVLEPYYVDETDIAHPDKLFMWLKRKVSWDVIEYSFTPLSPQTIDLTYSVGDHHWPMTVKICQGTYLIPVGKTRLSHMRKALFDYLIGGSSQN